MISRLIDDDILMMRSRYDQALECQGISCKYQFPNLASVNNHGEPEIDSYSEYIDAFIFFDGAPKAKTFKRYGWVVDNDSNLPFIVHCSWNLPKVQRDSLFTFSGMYSGLADRVFRVTEITYDLQCPDHLVCQAVPVANGEPVTGRTRREISQTFNKSNHFLNNRNDYRGNPYNDSQMPVE